jgi:hypothetical protein
MGRLDEARQELVAAKRELDVVPLHLAEVEYYLAITYWRGADHHLACERLASAGQNDPAGALPLPEDVVFELEQMKKGCEKE